MAGGGEGGVGTAVGTDLLWSIIMIMVLADNAARSTELNPD